MWKVSLPEKSEFLRGLEISETELYDLEIWKEDFNPDKLQLSLESIKCIKGILYKLREIYDEFILALKLSLKQKEELEKREEVKFFDYVGGIYISD